MIGTDLTKGKVSSTLLRFTLPFLVSNVLHTLYSIVDMFIVGRFADPVQLSAVSIGSLLMMIVNSLLMGFSAGGTVVVGQLSGAKRERDLRETVSTIFSFYPLCAIVLMALCLLLRHPLLRLINAPAESFAAATSYFTICAIGIIFTGCFVSIAAVLRGMGDSKGPTVFITISCVANIIGDYLCVGVLQMGAAGAALATSASQGLSVVVGLIYLRRRNFPFSFRPSCFRIYRGHLGRLLSIGIPTSFQEGMTGISFFVLEAFINNLGYLATAAAGIADRVFNVAIIPGLAFSQAISAMVAQNTGAGEYQRGRRSLRIGLLMSAVVAVLIFLVMALAPEATIGLFSRDGQVVSLGAEYMTFYKFDCVICTLAFCVNGYINGKGHTRYTMMLNVVSSFFVRLPLVWFISTRAGVTLYHIGIALPVASVVQLAIGVAFLLFSRSERQQREKLRGAH